MPRFKTVTASVTRPSDTNAYAIGDVIANDTPAVLEFANAGRASGEAVRIVSATLISSAFVATGPSIDLMLFSATQTPDADNAAYTPTDAELLTLVGVIPFLTGNAKSGDLTAGAGGNASNVLSNIQQVVNLPSGVSLYGVPVARNAYVPVASEKFTFILGIEESA